MYLVEWVFHNLNNFQVYTSESATIDSLAELPFSVNSSLLSDGGFTLKYLNDAATDAAPWNAIISFGKYFLHS